jgi:hypothetical protein
MRGYRSGLQRREDMPVLPEKPKNGDTKGRRKINPPETGKIHTGQPNTLNHLGGWCRAQALCLAWVCAIFARQPAWPAPAAIAAPGRLEPCSGPQHRKMQGVPPNSQQLLHTPRHFS